jgi:hypothetical protein
MADIRRRQEDRQRYAASHLPIRSPKMSRAAAGPGPERKHAHFSSGSDSIAYKATVAQRSFVRTLL